MRRRLDRGENGKFPGSLDTLMPQARQPELKDSVNGEKESVAKLFEQGWTPIICLLELKNKQCCLLFCLLVLPSIFLLLPHMS